MIRYPSSQLGEMSLEEHSQCECRCQPAPLLSLQRPGSGDGRVGGWGLRGTVVHHSGDQISKT